MKTADINKAVEIIDNILWVGFSDPARNLYCNPYLIKEGDEAVLIDGGSRTDFDVVMLKILQAGIKPQMIKRLIYQHYDPDLCSSVTNFEKIISTDDLKIISHHENNVFIRYYSVSSPLLSISSMNCEFYFQSGRKLKFIHTPFCHCLGSFITYDEKTKTLFSSDLFGSYDHQWQLFLELPENCPECHDYSQCTKCKIKGILNFHKRVMTSNKALQFTLKKIENLEIERICPQHGSIIENKTDITNIINRLKNQTEIGIDGIC